MQITFVTRKFRNVERNLQCDVLHITTVRVARLVLGCNGVFAIKAYGDDREYETLKLKSGSDESENMTRCSHAHLPLYPFLAAEEKKAVTVSASFVRSERIDRCEERTYFKEVHISYIAHEHSINLFAAPHSVLSGTPGRMDLAFAIHEWRHNTGNTQHGDITSCLRE